MIVKHILNLFAAAGRVNSKKYKVVSSEHGRTSKTTYLASPMLSGKRL